MLKKFIDFMVGNTAEEEHDRWVRDFFRAFPEPGVKPYPPVSAAEKRRWLREFVKDCRQRGYLPPESPAE